MNKANAVAEIVKAFASILWPLLIAGALYSFHDEIRGVLRRLSDLKKGKLFGQEFELEEKLDQLRAATQKVENEIPVPPQLDSGLPNNGPAAALEEQLLQESNRAPKVALMRLAAELDKKIRRLLAATGWYQNVQAGSTLSAIEALREQGSLPGHVSGSVKLFQQVRDRIIHGKAASDEDILRAIDSGITLLKAIESIPLETNTVYHSGVAIYSDPNCTQLISDCRGLILETISPGGSQTMYRIFPTTRTHFEKGKRVAWEWDLSRVWGPAWYHDPETGEGKPAWHSSGEFIGRHLDDL
ncbi:hypothetical protein [Bradyrhizobium sp. OK095]|uniref:hypothetical protein n=1 Tax=Bradyrhizobium sp. OK095 TaxID=1882760 RepID=UPI0008ACA218|nr:hypothetical protein [Bradyrhizobium sp. OK095]SEM76837.1 hypothetical protein SAMN05443254_103626 [Bradyrhizobium sp. OK095]